jgi:hypothetical protein
MSKLRIGRAPWLLAILVLATPIVLPLAGRDRSRAPSFDEQPESAEMANIVRQIIISENRYNIKMMEYSPRIETYLQHYEPDTEMGDVVKSDGIFLGRLKFATVEKEISFTEDSGVELFGHRPGLLPSRLYLDQFAVEPLAVDSQNFDQRHYSFEPVRWEYLGAVRCLAIDVHPREPAGVGAFQGRIWVEDHDYSIVRLNGTRVNPPRRTFYVHFDCWRENLVPGVWLPVYIYSQESDIGRQLRYKAETRLWGYDLTAHRQQQEWTNIVVDAPAPVRDNSEQTVDLSPVESQRRLSAEAEQNVLDRLEKARLIAPPGSVDKVLETVVNNLKLTNHLDNLPPVQCRVMLTSSLESFSLAYTIVLSRGLIDVLPDEASLAMILAHELGHIALGHKLDTKYAFNDRMIVSDEALLASLDLARSANDEVAADAKGMEFLKNSPYKDKLNQAGLFLRAAVDAAPHAPHMFGAHLGNGLTVDNKMVRMSALMSSAPMLSPRSLDQIAALPLGSRIQVNAWNGTVAFTDRKAVPIIAPSEKLPFRVTPVIPSLRIYEQPAKVEAAVRN